jgi:hypothetical protein
VKASLDGGTEVVPPPPLPLPVLAGLVVVVVEPPDPPEVFGFLTAVIFVVLGDEVVGGEVVAAEVVGGEVVLETETPPQKATVRLNPE